MLEVILLAVVQGLTEFLPVSSSGHLLLLPKIFHMQEFGLVFDAFLHLGTLLAALVYFRQEIIVYLKTAMNFILRKTELQEQRKTVIGIAFASLPAIIVGISFKAFFASDPVRSLTTVSITLIAGSILMFFCEKNAKNSKTIDQLSIIEIFWVGVFQCLALLPGFSRSGSTISAGLIFGLQRAEAARFSFLIGLPVIAGAGLLSLKDLLESDLAALNLDYLQLAAGFAFSFISGYFAIDFLIKFLKKNSLWIFIIYRIAIAIWLLV